MISKKDGLDERENNSLLTLNHRVAQLRHQGSSVVIHAINLCGGAGNRTRVLRY